MTKRKTNKCDTHVLFEHKHPEICNTLLNVLARAHGSFICIIFIWVGGWTGGDKTKKKHKFPFSFNINNKHTFICRPKNNIYLISDVQNRKGH